MSTNAQTWEDLEVRKRTLNFGSAGVLDAPDDVDFPPNAEGKASIRFRVSSRKETPLKDGAVEVTMILTITKIEIDPSSIVVPIPDPKLPGMDGKKTGQIGTVGAAVDEAMGAAIKAAVEAGAEVPPHGFDIEGERPTEPPADWDPPCRWCGLAASSGVHVADEAMKAGILAAPELTGIDGGKKPRGKSGTMRASRRPRARG